jgi:hypothetical protein
VTDSNLDPEQALADLRWVVESPAFAGGSDTEEAGALDVDAVDVDHLVATLGHVPPRVGHYFERLVAYWLEHCVGVEVEATGLQLSDPETGRTIGELDFVFLDHDGRRCHWETAVKFFLYDPERPGSHFPGPNVRDDYESKIAKLFDYQLTRPGAGEFAERHAFVKGCCFHHPLVGAPPALPDRMPADAMTGTWIRAGETDLLSGAWNAHGFTILDKPHWLAPPPHVPMSFAEFDAVVRDHFAQSRRTVMAAAIDSDGSESKRMCIVHQDW